MTRTIHSVPTKSNPSIAAKRNKDSPRSGVRPASRQKPASEGDTEHLLRRWRDVVPNDRMAHLVRHAMRALDRALQSRLAALGVSLGHWTFLRVLWETDGLTQRELSREAGVMEPTTFTALKAMEARGYITRRQLANNRRRVHIFLTVSGQALKRELVPMAIGVNRIALRGVPANDIVATRRTLLATLENLARDEARTRRRQRSAPASSRKTANADAGRAGPSRKR